jgi:molybdopterin synthase catalytic subunit
MEEENRMIQVTDNPIEEGKIYEQLSREGVGSVVVHFGIVKPVIEDRKTKGIRLTPDGDLEAELKNIEGQLRGKWDIVDVLLIRRIGELLVGETILAAAVSAASKDAAFGACEEAVETLKKKRALRKEELYEA